MKRAIAVLLLVLAVAAATQYRAILSGYAHFFTVDNATPGADAILVLGGNNIVRVPKAIELYKGGFAPRLLLTEPHPQKSALAGLAINLVEEAQAFASALSDDARFELMPSTSGGATSTFDEAHDLLAFAEREKLGRVIIVTDSFHTRRALLAFRKVLKDSPTRVEVAAAPNDIYDEDNWWRSDKGIEAYIVEPIKYLVYLFTSEDSTIVDNS